LTLDRVILHTVMHHSSTSTYVPNFSKIERNFLWTDGRTDGHLRPTLWGQLGEVDLIKLNFMMTQYTRYLTWMVQSMFWYYSQLHLSSHIH